MTPARMKNGIASRVNLAILGYKTSGSKVKLDGPQFNKRTEIEDAASAIAIGILIRTNSAKRPNNKRAFMLSPLFLIV
jgi:hypothetical protein